MEDTTTPNERKVMTGFKCIPALRIALTREAEALGITLSAHIETRLLAYENSQQLLKEHTETIKSLEERIAFYEQAPLLQSLYKANKGKTITYINQDGKTIDQEINRVQDVFTIIINSFKTKK